jgi:hypothetical protein
MPGFGREVLNATGTTIQVSADGAPHWKSGGITIDWTTVTPAASDTTLPDGVVILAGQKGLQFGTVLCRITANGMYGPFASGAADGRQTLTRDQCFIINETILQNGPNGVSVVSTNQRGVFDGGKVFGQRLGVGGAGPPTLAALEAVLPRLQIVTL